MTRTGRPPIDPALRFWPKVTPNGNCWLWTGTTNGGYGHFWHGTGRVYAHRWSYEHLVAPIPDGLTLDHLCHNDADCPGGTDCPHRRCVNPYHLDPVPSKVNTLRGLAITAQHARKTVCARGHEYPPGSRKYRECRADNNRRYRLEKKAAA